MISGHRIRSFKNLPKKYTKLIIIPLTIEVAPDFNNCYSNPPKEPLHKINTK